MLSKINTSLHSPDRPPRRPHGPRSAVSPPITPARGEHRTPIVDTWRTRSGPSTLRILPPQTSLPYDADLEQDPLFNILRDQKISHAPKCYRLKLIDTNSSTSDDEGAFETFFSFTASPVQSPSYSATAFTPRQPHRPAPLTLPLPSPSYLSPASASPNVLIRSAGDGDKVDRWIHGDGLEPMLTPMLVEDSPHESWDNGGQSDWREIIDHFLQHGHEHEHDEDDGDSDDGDSDDAHYPLTPVSKCAGERPRVNF
ncbi:hypothetical protein C8Q77DRAFT_1052929 [Trametes polyzona]|nr:hypothetical protein C8Q77DRAFT_1052929 [Trametes polyzona]